MNWLGRLVRRTRAEAELAAELRDHLERRVVDLVQHGHAEPEARRLAALELGGIEQIKESAATPAARAGRTTSRRTCGYGVRVLRADSGVHRSSPSCRSRSASARTPRSSRSSNGLLLRTLPVGEPSQLVLIDHGSWTNPIWEQVRDRHGSFAQQATAWGTERFDLAHGGQSEFVEGLYASGAYFDTLGVRADAGANVHDGRRPARRRARRSGRGDQLSGGGSAGSAARLTSSAGRSRSTARRFTIIGVTPPEFLGPIVGRAFDVTVPLGTIDLFRDGDENALDSRSWWWLDIMLRLKPGETIGEATRALRGVQPQIREATLPHDWPPQELQQYLRDGLTLVERGRRTIGTAAGIPATAADAAWRWSAWCC